MVLPLPRTVGITQDVAFLDWLLSRDAHPRSTSFQDLEARGFLALNGAPLSGCISCLSLTGAVFACFWVFVIIHKAAMNVCGLLHGQEFQFL